jgi:phosphate-selective porin OprO/OprP
VTRLIATSVLGLAFAGCALPAQAQTAQTADPVAARASPEAGEWSIKPRGRVQLDLGSVAAPTLDQAANQAETGTDARVRRGYIGVDGTMPGGFGFRIEADLAADPITMTDAYVFYKPRKDVTLTLGQHKPFWGIEEVTSDLFTSFQERAAFTSAFGFERRLGFSAAYSGKSVLVQAGIFADDLTSLGFPSSGTAVPRDLDSAYSLDTRAVFMPKIGEGQLHLGGSIHYRRFQDAQAVRYRARPFVRTTDLRFVDTRNIAGTNGELGLGLEAAYIRGRFHATAESFWQKALRPGLVSPTFNGGYAEVGYLLTNDATAYKGGVYDRIKPKTPLGKGGIGAVQFNLRYDWLDLNDAGIVGGRQEMAGVSLIWMPTDKLRFIADYGRLWLADSRVTAEGGRTSYAANAFGLRAQFDF